MGVAALDAPARAQWDVTPCPKRPVDCPTLMCCYAVHSGIGPAVRPLAVCRRRPEHSPKSASKMPAGS